MQYMHLHRREFDEAHANGLQILVVIKHEIVLHYNRFDAGTITRLAASGIEINERLFEFFLGKSQRHMTLPNNLQHVLVR